VESDSVAKLTPRKLRQRLRREAEALHRCNIVVGTCGFWSFNGDRPEHNSSPSLQHRAYFTPAEYARTSYGERDIIGAHSVEVSGAAPESTADHKLEFQRHPLLSQELK